jgi:heme exporter protein C
MFWKLTLFAGMSLVIVGAFATPSPMNPAFSLGNPEVYRIFYFHVPQAWVATLAFIISMVCSIRFLVTRNLDYDLKAVTACKMGLLFALMATITGSIFAKLTWGEFWNWAEIKEVSVFILLMMYGGYFALRSAVADSEIRASLSAVLSILFAVSAVFLIFILPRLYAAFSLHPTDSIIDGAGRFSMGGMVGIIFFMSLAAFTGLFLWIYRLSLQIQRAEGDLSAGRE